MVGCWGGGGGVGGGERTSTKTAAKWPKMIGFWIFKCLWNCLDEPDSTVPITLESAPPLVVKIGIQYYFTVCWGFLHLVTNISITV